MRGTGHAADACVEIVRKAGKEEVFEEPKCDDQPGREREFPRERTKKKEAEISEIYVHFGPEQEVRAHARAYGPRRPAHRNFRGEMFPNHADISRPACQ